MHTVIYLVSFLSLFGVQETLSFVAGMETTGVGGLDWLLCRSVPCTAVHDPVPQQPVHACLILHQVALPLRGTKGV